MLPNGKQRLFFSCFTVSCTSCRTGFTCFSTLSVRLLKLYSCFPTLSIGFIKSLQITVFARKNTQPCHTVRRVSDLKSAQHKKSSSAATWIFCMEPICFGIIKGEQPLVCNGDDRGQWPKPKYFQRKKILCLQFWKICGFSRTVFSRRGCDQKLHFLLICPDL